MTNQSYQTTRLSNAFAAFRRARVLPAFAAGEPSTRPARWPLWLSVLRTFKTHVAVVPGWPSADFKYPTSGLSQVGRLIRPSCYSKKNAIGFTKDLANKVLGKNRCSCCQPESAAQDTKNDTGEILSVFP